MTKKYNDLVRYIYIYIYFNRIRLHHINVHHVSELHSCMSHFVCNFAININLHQFQHII